MTRPQGRLRLTETQILDVMNRCEPRREQLVVGLLGLQGLRPRQVGWLLAGDVDLDAPALTLVTPEASDPWGWPRDPAWSVTADLHPELTRTLRVYLRYDRNAPRAPNDPLLTARPGQNRPITPEIVNHVVRKVSREAREVVGAEFTVADLRWSCAVNLQEAGVDEAWLSRLLGHDGVAQTRRFIERGFD